MEEELFKEVELVGKGTGLVASKDLPPGVLLLSESPLLNVPWWQRLAQFNRWSYFFCQVWIGSVCLNIFLNL